MQLVNEKLRVTATGERQPDFTVERGFTVMEIVVAVAMMAILTALALPAVSTYLSETRIDTTVSVLSDLRTSIARFRATIGNSPSRLSHLTRAIASTDLTSCTGVAPATPSTTYGATNAPKWVNGGPFYPKALSVTGLPVPIGTISDTLFRTSPQARTSFLNITIRLVRFQDAVLLNNALDGSGDVNQANRSNTSGMVQWGVPTADERVDVIYRVSIGSVC